MVNLSSVLSSIFGTDNKKKLKELKSIIFNSDNNNSCEIIGKGLQQVYKNKFDQKRDISRLTLSYKYFSYFLNSKLMQFKSYLFSRNKPEYLNQLNKKGLSKETVKQRIKNLSKADKLGGKYQVDETYYGIYSIKKLT